MPFPSHETMATRLRITPRQSKRIVKDLGEKGFLVRHPQVDMPNRYDLTPLFRKLEALQLDDNQKEAERKVAERIKALPPHLRPNPMTSPTPTAPSGTTDSAHLEENTHQ